MSSANKDSFTSPFTIWMPFISFCYLIMLPGTASTMLNTSNESKHPCLVSNFREKASSLLPLSIMLSVDFSSLPFIRLRNYSFIPSLLLIFIVKDCVTYIWNLKKKMVLKNLGTGQE